MDGELPTNLKSGLRKYEGKFLWLVEPSQGCKLDAGCMLQMRLWHPTALVLKSMAFPHPHSPLFFFFRSGAWLSRLVSAQGGSGSELQHSTAQQAAHHTAMLRTGSLPVTLKSEITPQGVPSDSQVSDGCADTIHTLEVPVHFHNFATNGANKRIKVQIRRMLTMWLVPCSVTPSHSRMKRDCSCCQ